MIEIYHNPRCSKSRQGLEILKNSGKDFKIIEYLKTPLTENQLSEIIDKLNIKPLDLIRKNESIWKEKYKDKDLNNSALIKIMTENPRLIERPIVVKDNLAVIGRPPENIEHLI